MKNVICFIPARGGSKRFKRKNVASLNGRPMISYPIEAAKASGIFNRIFVSSDDEEILQVATSANISIDHRPIELASDNASVADALQEFLKRDLGTEENICCIYPTAALLSAKTICDAYSFFRTNSHASSLMAVTHFNAHPWQALYKNDQGNLQPYFKDLNGKRSQDFPELYGDTGTIYFVRRNNFLKTPDFYQSPLIPFLVPAYSFVDINYPEDLETARLLLGVQTK